MNNRWLNHFILAFCFLTHTALFAQDAEMCRVTHMVIHNLEANHFAPPDFKSPTVLKEVVDLFMQEADKSGLFFIKSDQAFLDSIVSIQDNDAVCKTIDKAAGLFSKRIAFTDSIVDKVLSSEVKASSRDSIRIDYESKVSFSSGEKKHAARIEKRLLFKTLLKETNNKKQVNKSGKTTAQQSVRKQYEMLKPLAKTKSELKQYVAEKFRAALALRCDPHSNYFNISEKRDFEKQVSTTELSYGIIVKENENGEIEIAKLIPGSAAWRSNELNEGDIITRAEFDKLKNIDPTEYSSDFLNGELESSSTKQLKIIVKKKNGKTAEATITKTKIDSEQNSFDGYLLDGIHNRFGYISLPAFYTDYENFTGLGCANDVAKEILKLKKENINGLILDLRNNGGGSLTEAIDLAGIFINEGPVGILKTTNEKPYTAKDMNRGTVYDGPLLVLVNELSASASEFLAAALQDYNRAVIAGQPTFGKATGQYITPVDTNLKPGAGTSENGYLKITNLKLYRINGTTHQGNGVMPHVIIPDEYMYMNEYKESSEPFYLKPDSIHKKIIYQALPALPISELQRSSNDRVSSSRVFKQITGTANSISAFYKSPLKFSLSPEGIENYNKQSDKFHSIIEKPETYQSAAYRVLNNNYLTDLMNKSPEMVSDNAEVLKNLSYDPVLEEAFLILKDYCQLTQKK